MIPARNKWPSFGLSIYTLQQLKYQISSFSNSQFSDLRENDSCIQASTILSNGNITVRLSNAIFVQFVLPHGGCSYRFYSCRYEYAREACFLSECVFPSLQGLRRIFHKKCFWQCISWNNDFSFIYPELPATPLS